MTDGLPEFEKKNVIYCILVTVPFSIPLQE